MGCGQGKDGQGDEHNKDLFSFWVYARMIAGQGVQGGKRAEGLLIRGLRGLSGALCSLKDMLYKKRMERQLAQARGQLGAPELPPMDDDVRPCCRCPASCPSFVDVISRFIYLFTCLFVYLFVCLFICLFT